MKAMEFIIESKVLMYHLGNLRTTVVGGVDDTIQYNTIIYLKSITWGVVAQSPEPLAHVENARQPIITTDYNL